MVNEHQELIADANLESSNQRPHSAHSPHANQIDMWTIRQLLTRLGNPAIKVVLWDGTEVLTSSDEPVGTVVIHDRATLFRLIWQPSIAFAEGYQRGRIEIDGSIVDVCRAVEVANGAAKVVPWSGLRGFGRRRPSSVKDARSNIHQHYDLGNDFYRLWLDQRLVYTCAYFPNPDVSLDDAQLNKLDLVCRKLCLQHGDDVIEAGSGWGALALHMAAKYGVKVRSYNISHEQVEYARAQARRDGLIDRVTFIEDDWRNTSGSCDKFVSVGMLEHVGPENYRELGTIIDRVLRPSGLGLIHTIGRTVACPVDGWVQKSIFPGAEPPSLRQMMDIFEPHGFSILDVENLRRHYALTLTHWLDRFEQNVDRVRDMFDEPFVRAWRLYLAASIATFEYGGFQLFQVLFARARNNDIPWTRRD